MPAFRQTPHEAGFDHGGLLSRRTWNRDAHAEELLLLEAVATRRRAAGAELLCSGPEGWLLKAETKIGRIHGLAIDRKGGELVGDDRAGRPIVDDAERPLPREQPVVDHITRPDTEHLLGAHRDAGDDLSGEGTASVPAHAQESVRLVVVDALGLCPALEELVEPDRSTGREPAPQGVDGS